jgi:hypothetical protein
VKTYNPDQALEKVPTHRKDFEILQGVQVAQSLHHVGREGELSREQRI